MKETLCRSRDSYWGNHRDSAVPKAGTVGAEEGGEGTVIGNQRPQLPNRSFTPQAGVPNTNTLISPSLSPHPPDLPLAEARGQRTPPRWSTGSAYGGAEQE